MSKTRSLSTPVVYHCCLSLQIRLASSIANPKPVADGQQDIPHFTFSEGLLASEGFGYFQGGPGLTLGPDSCFNLQAKLGFGTASSVWIAGDRMYGSLLHRCRMITDVIGPSSDNIHVAIKILTGYTTRLNCGLQRSLSIMMPAF